MLILLNNSIYFEEIIFGLSECLTELQIPHQIQNYETNKDDIYLIFTTHELFRPLPKRYISYNLEQLSTNKKWPLEFFLRLKAAEFVLDYSQENIKILQEYNIQSHFLPLGFASCMNYHVHRNFNFTYKYGFIGAMNDYRYQKLQPILSKTQIVTNCWKEEKKKLFTKIHYAINIHYYTGNTILEIHRIIPLVANKILVFSEKSSDSYYDELYKPLVTFVDNFHNLPEYTNEEYKNIVEERYQNLITHYKFINYVQPFVQLFKIIQ